MTLGEWKAKLISGHTYGYMGYVLYMFRTTGSGSEVLRHDGTVVKIKEGYGFGDDNYFARFDEEALHVVADEFARYGVKTISDHKNEGLLAATKYHLEDMRKLALKGKK
jgi:hypothetical protein